ncbi:hypothetical protein V8E36_001677 [Tilletia maclaganii]
MAKHALFLRAHWDDPSVSSKDTMELDYGPSLSPSDDGRSPMVNALRVEVGVQTDPIASNPPSTRVAPRPPADDDGDDCPEDGAEARRTRQLTILPLLVPDIVQTYPIFLRGLLDPTPPAPSFPMEEARLFIAAVRKEAAQKVAGPHFDAVRLVHDKAISAVSALHRPDWAAEPCEIWAQVGLHKDIFDPHDNLSLQPLPEDGEIVQPFKVAVLLTFPTSSGHMAGHHKVATTANFTLALLGNIVKAYSWAENVIVLDSQLHAMDPDATVPWRSQAVFEHTFQATLSTNADVVVIAAGSNRERFGVMIAEQLKDKSVVDISNVLGAGGS